MVHKTARPQYTVNRIKFRLFVIFTLYCLFNYHMFVCAICDEKMRARMHARTNITWKCNPFSGLVGVDANRDENMLAQFNCTQ